MNMNRHARRAAGIGLVLAGMMAAQASTAWTLNISGPLVVNKSGRVDNTVNFKHRRFPHCDLTGKQTSGSSAQVLYRYLRVVASNTGVPSSTFIGWRGTLTPDAGSEKVFDVAYDSPEYLDGNGMGSPVKVYRRGSRDKDNVRTIKFGFLPRAENANYRATFTLELLTQASVQSEATTAYQAQVKGGKLAKTAGANNVLKPFLRNNNLTQMPDQFTGTTSVTLTLTGSASCKVKVPKTAWRTGFNQSGFDDVGTGYGFDQGGGDAAGTLVIGDINRDGMPDIAVAGRTGITVMRGDISGRLHTVQTLATDGAQGQSITLEDANLDGNADIVVRSEDEPDGEVFAGDGTGTFAVQPELALQTGTVRLQTDLNGDDVMDEVRLNEVPNHASIYVGDGDGNLARVADLPTGDAPAAVVASDLDRDGVTDLVVNNEGSNDVSVFKGIGQGEFLDEQIYLLD